MQYGLFCSRKSCRFWLPALRYPPPILLALIVLIEFGSKGLNKDLHLSSFPTKFRRSTKRLLNQQSPTFQSFGTYVLIALVYIPVYIYKTETSFSALLKAGWWKYAILALIDFEANYTIVKAYQYTSITSVQMLDSATLFFVFVFSLIFLQRKYSKTHYLLIVVVLGGVALMIFADVSNSPEDGIGAEWLGITISVSPCCKVLGSVLVIIACFLYATSNTAMEYIVKHSQNGTLEYLSQLGLFGTIFSGIQLYLFERDELASVLSNSDLNLTAFGWFFCFWICMFLLYSLMPGSNRQKEKFLTQFSRVFLNLCRFHEPWSSHRRCVCINIRHLCLWRKLWLFLFDIILRDFRGSPGLSYRNVALRKTNKEWTKGRWRFGPTEWGKRWWFYDRFSAGIRRIMMKLTDCSSIIISLIIFKLIALILFICIYDSLPLQQLST